MAGETKQPPPEKSAKGEFVRFLGVASTIGINFVASTLSGFAIGYWILDRIFNTFPWFTVIFMILGIAAGFMYLFRIAAKAGRYDDSDSGQS
ncbi:MAG TPA: AtpZ/AtpI family protein [Nitrospirae bacterium]|nr:AtpZ/AtpI family protein [Nitrospirota bacterium]